MAWKNGIMVIAAAGNQGSGSKFDGLADPAYDPTVLAVGASQSNDSVIGDDTVPSFSSVAGDNRRPDLVAPGTHIQSLRDPGSYIDQTYGSTGGITPRFFRGSGTSQATAAASGAAALIFSQHPNATPDQVKSLLNQTATHIPGGNSASGNGVLNLNDAFGALLPYASAFSLSSTGLGTIEAARGSNHVSMNGVTLSGEQDIFGRSLTSSALASAEAAIGGLLGGGPWNGGVWNGSSWSGSSWSGSSWSGSSWSGSSWSGSSWSGSSWSGSSWSTNTWLGSSWSGSSWSSSNWS